MPPGCKVIGLHAEFLELDQELIGTAFNYVYFDVGIKIFSSNESADFPVDMRYHMLTRVQLFRVRERMMIYANIECCTLGKTHEIKMLYGIRERIRKVEKRETRVVSSFAFQGTFSTDPMFVESTWENMKPWWKDAWLKNKANKQDLLIRQLEIGVGMQSDDYRYPYTNLLP